MPLVPYEPFRQLDQMRREMDQFFNNDFSALRSMRQNLGNLSVDVYETGSEVVAMCDIPGLEKKEDVHIDIEHNTLSISGTLKKTNDMKEEQMHRQERYVGRFQRLVTLPANVSPDNVKATYKNGVLEVHMQKQGETKKRIDVEFH
ncbi:Hsp20/alpha crystallin family protein [Paenibacillus sp. KQZ6P-2]|uniref:Hsp20/alpha crystallin family protein n=1 Tax=Paenibacillus mangrovi TaxID=2931978 RepID=A0A9X1WUJ3_9BACL|nr:Hsp20/alpha crystallin family protein [Paenibacillus mangrovi]MCJ8014936.1 Hsp20/alpha crystallin family protein [Paenibacillus mangrovi]